MSTVNNNIGNPNEIEYFDLFFFFAFFQKILQFRLVFFYSHWCVDHWVFGGNYFVDLYVKLKEIFFSDFLFRLQV